LVNNFIKQLQSEYQRRFGSPPTASVSAPGRINLIGEHTDYSEGYVLPVAIDRKIFIAFTPRSDDLVGVYSMDFDEYFELHVGDFDRQLDGWKAFITGVAWAFYKAGYVLNGWQGVVAGNIPIGAGLSSSAALEVAAGTAFCLSSGINISPTQLALIAQTAEVDWVGVNVGIMDLLIAAGGKKNHALLLDCRTLNYEYVLIPTGLSLIVLDTMTRRTLSTSSYNNRHDEVKLASQILGVKSLRDASMTLLENFHTKLSHNLYLRASHVIQENQRTVDFTNAMRNSNLLLMGKLVNDSHISLRDKYEVSSPELDLIVSLAQKQPGCLGARMIGAGFGGCALALLQKRDLSQFAERISTSYHKQTGLIPHIFTIKSADGVTASEFNDPFM